MHITPVASATPDGTFRVIRPLRWIPRHELNMIEWIEEDYRMALEERPTDAAEDRWQNQVQRLTNASLAGLEEGELTQMKASAGRLAIEEFGTRRHPSREDRESRSHSRSKERMAVRLLRKVHPRNAAFFGL